MQAETSHPRGFAQVETWVFDLDNTLYPHHLNLWQQVDDRIRAYISDFLKVPPDEAFRIRAAFRLLYGRPPTDREVELGTAFLAAEGEDAWVKYAQVLLSANEFAFVD